MGFDLDRKGRRIRPVSALLAKSGFSLLFGAIAFLIVQATIDRPRGDMLLFGVATAVFVSGMAFVAQFFSEAVQQLERVDQSLDQLAEDYSQRVREMRELIKDEFTKINAATELFGLVEASALKTDVMTQLVRNATTVAHGTPSLIFDFAQSEIARLSGYLKDLGQGGDVTYEGEDRDWLLALTKVATSTIDATSLTTVDAGGRGFVEGSLWTSDLGQQYLEAQREAIKRGVVIRRIFVMDRPALRDETDFTTMVRQHLAIGVKVRILRPEADDVFSTRRASLFDFIVLDGVLSYQATTASRPVDESRPIIITTTLVTNGTRVQERIERFKDLWSSAKEFPPRADPAG